MAGSATSLPPQFDPKTWTTRGSASFGGNDTGGWFRTPSVMSSGCSIAINILVQRWAINSKFGVLTISPIRLHVFGHQYYLHPQEFFVQHTIDHPALQKKYWWQYYTRNSCQMGLGIHSRRYFHQKMSHTGLFKLWDRIEAAVKLPS
jgi:hypothetical protein